MRLGFFASSLLAGLALAVTGCSVGGAPEGVVATCDQQLDLPPGVATDILFVIDDSLSMSEEQEKVAAELENFVSALRDGPIPHDFQVGVVTTGVSVNAGTCGGEPSYRRLEDEAGRLQPVEDGGPRFLSWDDPGFLPKFQALVRQGVQGSGQEMGLEAMRLALSKPLTEGENSGFLRPGARLLVVIVSDEDDCSDPTGTALALSTPCDAQSCSSDDQCGGEGNYCLPTYRSNATSCQPNACETTAGRAKLEPVDRYVEFLRGLDDGRGFGRKRDVFLAVIGAVSDDDSHAPERCSSGNDQASGIAVRYKDAVDAMGDHGYVDSICAGEYGSSLRAIAELVTAEQTIDLAAPPADERLLRVEIERANGDKLVCTPGDGFRYEPPAGELPARVVLEDRCHLQLGDRVDVRLWCAA